MFMRCLLLEALPLTNKRSGKITGRKAKQSKHVSSVMQSSILPEWVSTCQTVRCSCRTNSCGLILGKNVSKRAITHFDSTLESYSAVREIESFVMFLFLGSITQGSECLLEFRAAQSQGEPNGPLGRKLRRGWDKQTIVPSMILEMSGEARGSIRGKMKDGFYLQAHTVEPLHILACEWFLWTVKNLLAVQGICFSFPVHSRLLLASILLPISLSSENGWFSPFGFYWSFSTFKMQLKAPPKRCVLYLIPVQLIYLPCFRLCGVLRSWSCSGETCWVTGLGLIPPWAP